jgi:hypothetical protein
MHANANPIHNARFILGSFLRYGACSLAVVSPTAHETQRARVSLGSMKSRLR